MFNVLSNHLPVPIASCHVLSNHLPVPIASCYVLSNHLPVPIASLTWQFPWSQSHHSLRLWGRLLCQDDGGCFPSVGGAREGSWPEILHVRLSFVFIKLYKLLLFISLFSNYIEIQNISVEQIYQGLNFHILF